MVFRLVGWVLLMHQTWSCAATWLVVKLGGTGLGLQSIKFSITMVAILKARAAEYAERKVKKVKMRWLEPLSKEEIAKVEAYNKKQGKQYVP